MSAPVFVIRGGHAAMYFRQLNSARCPGCRVSHAGPGPAIAQHPPRAEGYAWRPGDVVLCLCCGEAAVFRQDLALVFVPDTELVPEARKLLQSIRRATNQPRLFTEAPQLAAVN